MTFPHLEKTPVFGRDVFLAPSATVIGDVQTGDDVSFWFGVVVRGDVNRNQFGSSSRLHGQLHRTRNLHRHRL